MQFFLFTIFLLFCFASSAEPPAFIESKNKTGSVIFIHPDGMSLAHWDIVRLVKKGYDGFLNFDFLPQMAVYRGTLREQITATSNAAGTIHAFGIKAGKKSFGMDKGKKIISAEGNPHSILISAKKKGLMTALCQSGALVEPGTAAFAVQVKSRKNKDEIARQIIESGVDLIFGGGEKFLLPQGVKGHYGAGARADNLNLVELAKNLGYSVIYNLKQFKKLPRDTAKVLGIFAYEDTYHSETEEVLKRKGLRPYKKNAPTIAEIMQAGLEFLKRKDKPFLMIVEEEGTDNFSNKKNARGFLEAAKRADDAIGLAREFLKANPRTLLLTASDSNAGGPAVGEPLSNGKRRFLSFSNKKLSLKKNVPAGSGFSRGRRFSTKKAYPFSILWSSSKDLFGGVVVKAEGLNADRVKGVIENTELYDLMYLTLFGKEIN